MRSPRQAEWFFDGDHIEFFRHRLSSSELGQLKHSPTKVSRYWQVAPVVAAAKFWMRRTAHRRVFYFVDNDAARLSLIKMHSDNSLIAKLLRNIVRVADREFPLCLGLRGSPVLLTLRRTEQIQSSCSVRRHRGGGRRKG